MKGKKYIAVIGVILVFAGILIWQGKKKPEPMFEDGLYSIEKLYEDRIYIKSADGASAQGTVSISPETEISIYGIESLVNMPVQCSYSELCASWNPQKQYNLHFIFQNSEAMLISVREYSEADECYSYVEEEEFGQLFYTGRKTKDNALEIVPVRFMAQDEQINVESLVAAGVDPENIAYEEDGGYICVSCPERQGRIAVGEGTRCYVLTPYYAVRCTMDELWECYTDQSIFRIISDGNHAVCVILYEIM